MNDTPNGSISTKTKNCNNPGRLLGRSGLTIRAIFLGLVLSVIMGAANVYLGLKVGMTVSASIPAAVLALVILRFFRNFNILEANQVQTGASAGESLAAGIIFTMPALVLIGAWTHFNFWITTLVAFTGGLLGILFMIPMRRVFVTPKNTELKYPEGVACAAVLKTGDKESHDGAGPIVLGGILGLCAKLFTSFFGIMKGNLEGATAIANRVFYFGGDVSPALVAVGYIVGLNVAVLVFIGGSIAWIIGIPLLGGAEGDVSFVDMAWTLWSTKIRYVGVGGMVVGGIASIYQVRHGLVKAVSELKNKANGQSRKEINEEDKDIHPIGINVFLILAVVLISGIYYYLTGNAIITATITVVMVVMSFFFTAVASYIVGLVGNSNSPVSGMTITTVLFTAGMLFVLGYSGMEGMVATMGVAAIVCCAACTSGDVCNDLKTGHIVGAFPYTQQIMQISGVAVAAFVMAPVLQLLHDNVPGGIGGRELAAPQAALFASLAKGFFGDGELKWRYFLCGAVIGIVFLYVDSILKKRGSQFRAYLMPIAVGMYLPFGLSIPMLIGGILNHLICKKYANKTKDRDKVLRKGILFSSGAIAGESLMGIGLAFFASLGIKRLDLGLSDSLITTITVLAAILIVVSFRLASPPKEN